MYSKLYNNVFFPLYETFIRRRSTLKYLKYLNATQWYTHQEVKDLQWRKLHALIVHSYENVPYYRKVFTKLYLHPDNIKTIQDFQKIPILTKQDIRNNQADLLAENYKNTDIFNTATGGSTGIPLQLALDHNNYEWRQAIVKRVYGWSGYRDGERTVFIWGGSVGKVSTFQKLKHGLDELLKNHKYFNTFNFTEKNMLVCANQINTYRPNYIVAYATPLYNFARFLKTGNNQIWRPKAIITAAEKLFPFQRELIEQIFQCPVFETYGCREVTSIAGECEKHNGMHINAENIYVEILNGQQVESLGEVGEIVITDLTNYCMPLIRYKNEDLGSLSKEECSCGRGLPLIKNIEGRLLDTIQTADGKYVPGEFFPHLMKDFGAINQFQVIQENIDNLIIKIVKTESFDYKMLSLLKQEIAKVMGARIRIDIQFVDEIPLTQTGKHRVVMSKVPFNLTPRA